MRVRLLAFALVFASVWGQAPAAGGGATVTAQPTNRHPVVGGAEPITGAVELNLQYHRGMDAYRAGRFDEALKIWRDGLEASKRTKDPLVPAYLMAVGNVLEDLSRYPEALATHQESLAYHRDHGDHFSEAGDLANISGIQYRMGRTAEALSTVQQALTIYRSYPNANGEIAALTQMSLLQERLGRFSDALATGEQILTIVRRKGDREEEAHALTNRGGVETSLGRYSDALRSEQTALEIYRKVGNRRGEAAALGNIGLVQMDLDEYAEAMSSNRDALAIYQSIGNRLGEANTLAHSGSIYENLGQYDAALATHQQALAIQRDIGDPTAVADSLNNIAIVSLKLGRYADALAAFEQSLSLSRTSKDRRGEATALANLAGAEASLGRGRVALEHHRQALALAVAMGDRLGEATSLNMMGPLEADLGRTADALRHYDRARALFRTLRDRKGESDVLPNSALLRLTQRRYADALPLAKAARELGLPIGGADQAWRAVRMLAVAEQHLARTRDALGHYEEALGMLDQLRTGLADTGDRRAFVGTALFVYEDYLDYLLDLNARFPGAGYDRRAFSVFEREQARSFLEEMGRSSTRRFRGVPESVTAEEQELDRAGERLRVDLARARTAERPDGPAIAALERELATTQSRREALKQETRRQYPEYYALRNPTPVDAQTLQSRVLRPGEALLIYRPLGDRTALWLVDRDGLLLVSLRGGAAVLRTKVSALRRGPERIQSLLDAGPTPSRIAAAVRADLPLFARDSFDLYSWLTPPAVRARLARAKSVVIVPTSSLYDVPWEALVTRAPEPGRPPHYLLEDVPVTYVSSASLLEVLRRPGRRPVRPAPNSLLAFANPTFGAAAAMENGTRGVQATTAGMQARTLARYVRAARGGAQFPQLPGAEREVDAVARALQSPPEVRSIYVGEQASRETVMRLQQEQRLEGFRYVVFATHAVLPDQIAGLLQPSLILAHPDQAGRGFLSMSDVFGLSLNADLVTLSACNTGRGIPTAAEGVRGLTQAFMYAGTPAVSVTLWEVADDAAQALSPRFYEQLHRGGSPAEALRQAKLELIRGEAGMDPNFRHPFFWAATVVFGDGDTAPPA